MKNTPRCWKDVEFLLLYQGATESEFEHLLRMDAD